MATLAIAALCWVAVLARMDGMAMNAGMGLGPFAAFISSWALMMAAMMLPSAVPLASRFAGDAEGGPWPAAAALLLIAYLAVWVAFGTVAYAIYQAVVSAGLPGPWHGQALLAGIALAIAGAYSLTPLQHASRERCRALCVEEGGASRSFRDGALRGLRYGAACVGCSFALMIALLVIGLASVAWMVIVAALVAVYKLAAPPAGLDAAIATFLVASGAWMAIWPGSVPSALM